MAVLGAGAVAWVLGRRREASRIVIDRTILRIPIYGRISEARQAARVVRTLRHADQGGRRAPACPADSLDAGRNADMRDRLHRAVADIRAGVTIGDAITQAGALPEVRAG